MVLSLNRDLGKKRKEKQKFILNSSMRDLRHNKSHGKSYLLHLAQAVLESLVVKPTEQTKHLNMFLTPKFFLVDFSSKRLINGVRQQNIKAKSVNGKQSKPNDICD